MSDYFLITNSKCRRQNGIADIALNDDIKHLKFEIKSKFSEIDREMKVYQRKSEDLDVVKDPCWFRAFADIHVRAGWTLRGPLYD